MGLSRVTASTYEPNSEPSVGRKRKIGSILWPPVLISRPAVQRQHSLTCLILPHMSEKRTAFLGTIGKRWASEGLTRSAEPRRAKVRDDDNPSKWIVSAWLRPTDLQAPSAEVW